jgi:hypothetical protein
MRDAAFEFQAWTVEGVARDLVEKLERYVRAEPVSASLWALGIGFVLGWKLKPW